MIDFDESLRVLGATPAQANELRSDQQRAEGWFEWARLNGKGIGAVLNEYRTGLEAPDTESWYDDQPKRKNPAKLRAACHALVEHTGHEYLEEDLLEELHRIYPDLPELDEQRLLNLASQRREAWSAGQPERDAIDEAHALAWRMKKGAA